MISDEIRNWREFEDGTECGGFVTKASFDKLCDLADRIDAEMVELPRSADGRIFTSYEVCFWTDSGDEFEYHRFGGLVRQDGKWFAEDSDGIRYEPKFAWLEHPDSFERIADELEEWSEDNRVNGDREVFDRAADFSERIRRLAKREDDNK